MKISAIGIDIAKNVFQLHGVDEGGAPVLRRQLRRAQLVEFFAKLAPCLVGMEACGGSHFWARKLRALGHEVRLIAPQLVKPYVRGQKNDANDARAICEALQRPDMRFVAVKSVQQQALCHLHTSRSRLMKQRIAQTNSIRAVLAEHGLVLPQGMKALRQGVPELLDDASNELLGSTRVLLQDEMALLAQLQQRIDTLDGQIKAQAQANPVCQRLQQLPGVGPQTASALVAQIDRAQQFENSRQLPAAVGVVPRQHSSGGKSVLLGITKRGNEYLRWLFIHGARSVIKAQQRKPAEQQDPWIHKMLQTKHANVVAVALAARTMRRAWALLRYDSHYHPGYRGAGRDLVAAA
ncbi:MAG: IS110 family transposase [Betaproteobacteria bacterium]|nr:IS110 family transposase [Betaproteobacteria bacterium]